MISKSINYFEWADIRKAICSEMKINEKHFENYHNIVGGEYKNLWKEWLYYFESDITRGSIKTNDLGEVIESKLRWIKEDDKEWLEPFVKAVYKVWNDNKIKYIQY